MSLPFLSDTIVAPATPVMTSALAIIRVSGRSCFSIMEKSLQFSKKKKIEKIPAFSLRRAFFVDFENSQKIIDDVMVSIMKCPRSYTGEDMIEITCHGNPFIVNLILQKIQNSGARLAFPGEFTQRSFLMGKKDLTQAEAVCDVIHSRCEHSLNRSLRSLFGGFHEKIKKIIDELDNVVLYLEAELDFSEEEIDFLDEKKYLEKIDKIIVQVDQLSQKFQRSESLRNGVSIAIIGAPNVGKSSLLNALLKTNRIIVSHKPGTTTDVIDAEIFLNKHRIQFFDTAGIRKTDDLIEQEGVLKSFETLKRSDFIFFVSSVDCFDRSHKELFDMVNEKKTEGQEIFFILNKEDLLMDKNIQFFEKQINKKVWLSLSTFSENKILDLENKIIAMIENKFCEDSSDIMINGRHKKALFQSLEALKNARNLNLDSCQEMIIVSLKESLILLNEIIGQQYDKNMLNKIFSKFCIGK